MIKTLGFGVGAMMGPALLTGAILYTGAPEAEMPATEQTMLGAADMTDAHDGSKIYKDYGVVWTKL